jgi:group I intron endonuclease
MNAFGIIYLVRNKINGKVYIGQTTKTVNTRWSHHRTLAHKGKSRSIFHRAIRKYGASSFDVVMLHQAFSRDELNEMEIRAIWTHDSADREYGYNMTLGGEGGSQTAEVRERMSKSMLGNNTRPRTDEEKQRMSLGILRRFAENAVVLDGQSFHPGDHTGRVRLLIPKESIEHDILQGLDTKGMARKYGCSSRLMMAQVKHHWGLTLRQTRKLLTGSGDSPAHRAYKSAHFGNPTHKNYGQKHSAEAKQKCRDVANRRWEAHRKRVLNE